MELIYKFGIYLKIWCVLTLLQLYFVPRIRCSSLLSQLLQSTMKDMNAPNSDGSNM